MTRVAGRLPLLQQSRSQHCRKAVRATHPLALKHLSGLGYARGIAREHPLAQATCRCVQHQSYPSDPSLRWGHPTLGQVVCRYLLSSWRWVALVYLFPREYVRQALTS
jgi:hypothetical protein